MSLFTAHYFCESHSEMHDSSWTLFRVNWHLIQAWRDPVSKKQALKSSLLNHPNYSLNEMQKKKQEKGNLNVALKESLIKSIWLPISVQ